MATASASGRCSLRATRESERFDHIPRYSLVSGRMDVEGLVPSRVCVCVCPPPSLSPLSFSLPCPHAINTVPPACAVTPREGPWRLLQRLVGAACATLEGVSHTRTLQDPTVAYA